jgi:DNA-binding transcriptional ArsR family regulator
VTIDPQSLLAALSDPTRFEVLSRLTESGPVSATDLARDLPVSRQAIVKHLNALSDAGLVERRQSGREIHWEYSAGSLDDLARWAQTVGSEWDRRLERLKRELD